jgi:hypothetical protein
MQNWGEMIFSNQQVGMRVYMRIAMTGVKSNKLCHSKKPGCSHIETFKNTPGPHLMERLTDCSHIDK